MCPEEVYPLFPLWVGLRRAVSLPSKSCLLRKLMNSCSALPRQISLCHTDYLAEIPVSSVLERVKNCHSLNQNLISQR